MVQAAIKTLVFSMVVAVGSATGCAVDDDVESSEFRSGGWSPAPDFWNWGLGYAGNEAVALHDGDGPLVPDCIIWDIDGGDDVYEGPEADGELLLSVVDNEVVGPDGTLECFATEEGGLFKLRDTQGQVLYTASLGRFVFEGDVQQLPAPGTSQWQTLLNERLAFEFFADQVFEGPRWMQKLLGTADAEIKAANPMRKLLIAALFGAECGSNGPREILPPPG